jgi:hypothetical protein
LKAAVKSRLKEGFAEWEAPVSAFILIGQPQAADKALNGSGQQDSNLRHQVPKTFAPSALCPDNAMRRFFNANWREGAASCRRRCRDQPGVGLEINPADAVN